MHVIDSHIHCGIQNVNQPFSMIRPLLETAGIEGACLFAPVEDIYDRYDRSFDDNHTWRACRTKAHDYLVTVSKENEGIIPYYFVWNDFAAQDLEKGFKGIKWHHHSGEPPYHYEDPRCTDMIDAICDRRLPIVLEETLSRTLKFIDQIAERTPVIIPHLGLLNGGFRNLLSSGIWDSPMVYADTALAGYGEISAFLDRYGPDRLLFGSDWPFGSPGLQLEGLKNSGIGREDLQKICSGNILRLMSQVAG
jgi:hypothetical protein